MILCHALLVPGNLFRKDGNKEKKLRNIQKARSVPILQKRRSYLNQRK